MRNCSLGYDLDDLGMKEVHEHKFETPATQKVLLTSGRRMAVDILKQRKCACGAVETYDLERSVK